MCEAGCVFSGKGVKDTNVEADYRMSHNKQRRQQQRERTEDAAESDGRISGRIFVFKHVLLSIYSRM